MKNIEIQRGKIQFSIESCAAHNNNVTDAEADAAAKVHYHSPNAKTVNDYFDSLNNGWEYKVVFDFSSSNNLLISYHITRARIKLKNKRKMLNLEEGKQYRIQTFGQQDLPIVTVKHKHEDNKSNVDVHAYWLEWDNDFKSWANRTSPRVGHYFFDHGIANQGKEHCSFDYYGGIIRTCKEI